MSDTAKPEHQPPTPEQIRAQQQQQAEQDLARAQATNLPAVAEPSVAAAAAVTATAVPAFSKTNDGWEETAKESDGRLIQGQRLNFSEGSWTIGKEQTMFDTTRRLVALGIVTAWVEWLDQRPNRVIVKQSGQPFPDREDLDHQDQTRWPKGPSGDPKDPWARTMHVYFADEKTSAGFTFASSAWGAKSSISDLATTIRNHRFKEPGALPVVTLNSAPHKTKFGMKKKPAFDIVGWTSGGMVEATPTNNGSAGGHGVDAAAKPVGGCAGSKIIEAPADGGMPYDDPIPF